MDLFFKFYRLFLLTVRLYEALFGDATFFY